MKHCVVGDRVVRNLEFLKRIIKTRKKKKILRLIDSATADQLLAIVEVATNILNSNFCIDARQRRRLQPYAPYLRRLSRVKTEVGARKMIQKGEGAMFAALLAPVITEVARYFIDRYIQ